MTPQTLAPQPFSWQFTAVFRDGSKVVQDPNDHGPDTNSFKLVLDRLDDLVTFELNHIDGQQQVFVDLMSGNFMVNNTPIAIHNQRFEPQMYKLELVYFREKREEQTLNAKAETVSQKSYVNRYFIGWKTEVNGKDKQVTLAVG